MILPIQLLIEIFQLFTSENEPFRSICSAESENEYNLVGRSIFHAPPQRFSIYLYQTKFEWARCLKRLRFNMCLLRHGGTIINVTST